MEVSAETRRKIAKGSTKPGEGSLTTDLYAYGDAETIALRRATRAAARIRNKANQLAIGNWHNESRGKMVNVPFPTRRTT